MIFSVLSYNIRKGKGYRKSNPHISDISNYISQQECDVVMCQEVAENKHSSDCQSQCCHIANTLNMDHYYGANACYNDGSHGNATFSAFPSISNLNINVTTNPFEYRGILYSVLRPNDSSHIHVFNVHLGLTPGQRRKQIRLLMNFINSTIPEEDPIIIAGDFNDFGGVIKKIFAELPEFESATNNISKPESKTWPSHRPLFQLDNMFYRNLKLIDVQTLQGQNKYLSDHLALYTKFELQ